MNYKELYEILISTGEYSTISDRIEKMNMVETINNIISPPEHPTKAVGVEELGYIINILQYVYNNTGIDNIISDDQYDRLYEIYLKCTGDNIIGAENPTDRKTGYHKYPDLRGTLEKVYWINSANAEDNRTTLYDWMRKLENKYNVSFLTDVEIVLLPKWDGVSLIFENDENGICQRALTRGDVITNKAVDLSDYFKGIQFDKIPENLPFGLKTECVVSDMQFDNLNKTFRKFATNRNAVSGLLNNKDVTKKIMLDNITIIPLQYQVSNNPPKLSPDMLKSMHRRTLLSYKSLDGLQNMLLDFRQELDSCGIDYDGVVIRLDNKLIQEKVGRTDHINNYEVAFKFPAPKTEAVLEDVVFQIGLLGAVTPVAKITPTKINGKIVSSVSLGSIERMKTLNPCKGDTVSLLYDIIPYIESIVRHNGGESIDTIETCPICSTKLTESPVLGCYNKNCDINIIGRINNFCVKMNIPNLSGKRIATLFDKGLLRSIEDIYRLQNKEDAFVSIKGLGEKMFYNIISSIKSVSKVNEYTLLGSLGIRGVGRKIFKKISCIYYIHELQDICSNNDYTKLTELEGIEYDTAMKIINGINSNRETIEFLCSELTIINTKDTRSETEENKVHVCFTGIRDKEFEKHLIGLGLIIAGSYTNKVDILICKNTDDSSSKIKKARKADKNIMSLSEAYEAFNFKK